MSIARAYTVNTKINIPVMSLRHGFSPVAEVSGTAHDK